MFVVLPTYVPNLLTQVNFREILTKSRKVEKNTNKLNLSDTKHHMVLVWCFGAMTHFSLLHQKGKKSQKCSKTRKTTHIYVIFCSLSYKNTTRHHLVLFGDYRTMSHCTKREKISNMSKTTVELIKSYQNTPRYHLVPFW